MDKVEWLCPKCGATPNAHGKGGPSKCEDRLKLLGGLGCLGFLCECDEGAEDEDHGVLFSHPCLQAVCYHCGWEGRFPPLPKKAKAWEKQALQAGWTPPPGWKTS